MEGQSSDSLSEQQCLETQLTEMLQCVEPPEKYDINMQCIYRVPQKNREINSKAYTPQIVSIGPFHKAREVGNEDNILESMEELKLKYLKGFLHRTQLYVGYFLSKLKTLEEDIRSCYVPPVNDRSHDFLKMILIDACFIIEHFLRWNRYRDWKENDPLLKKPWMVMSVRQDLILLENQLPFFVLEQLYDLTSISEEFPSFLDISLSYFKHFGLGSVRPRESPKHFTDLLRSVTISSSKLFPGTSKEWKETNHVYSASQLMEAGLKFKVSPNESLLDLTYSQGVLSMPILNIDDDAEVVFRNIVAFENIHLSHENIISQYLVIIDFLINTEKDVNLLVDKKIIVNWTGDANAAAKMVNSLCSKILMPYFNSHYFSLCNSLNDFYENPRNKYKAIFIHEYFNTPWKIASTVAGIMLLLLTSIQTICSIISAIRGK